jgi:tRNA(Ser,Leu) C12 N-acetylase TAN1
VGLEAHAGPRDGREGAVKDWNVVISIYQDGFREARRALKQFGPVELTPYHNVLVMRVDNPAAMLEAVERKTEEVPALYDAISRVAPAARTFEFDSTETFKAKAQSILLESLPRLAGRSFHVRLHRRGQRQDLRSPDVERFLDDILLDASKATGTPARIAFTDPDAVVAIDTVDDRAGIGVWMREDLEHHRLLRPD